MVSPLKIASENLPPEVRRKILGSGHGGDQLSSRWMARSEANLGVLEKFVAERKWVAFLAADKASRSNTSVCLNITAPWFTALAADKQAAAAKKMADLLESEKAGYDVGSYRDAPPGLRIWCGATVEQSDLEALLPWLDWAYGEIEREFGKAAA